MRKFLPLAQLAFSPDKFIVGLNALEIVDSPKKLRRLFKVYEPMLDDSMYDCEVLKVIMEVRLTFTRLLMVSRISTRI
jgi:hypothetical protein